MKRFTGSKETLCFEYWYYDLTNDCISKRFAIPERISLLIPANSEKKCEKSFACKNCKKNNLIPVQNNSQDTLCQNGF